MTAEADGGDGGTGTSGAGGGNGGAATATNAVSGSSAGGRLLFIQRAYGGKGGDGSGGAASGKGGAATSNLTFDDTANANKSATITSGPYYPGTSNAYGGDGGNGTTGSAGGAGGAATASSNITGTGDVTSAAYAEGGNGGAGSTSGAGGNATSTASAIGNNVTSSATSIAGSGAGTAASAAATAAATGVAGSFVATATSDPGSGQLIRAMTASASGSIKGQAGAPASGVAQAGVSYGTATAANDTSAQAISRFVGNPLATSVNSVKNNNSNIAAAFGAGSTVYAMGELGGAYDTSGMGSETINASVSMTIDPTLLASSHNLKLGLYGGTIKGAGFDSMTFTVTVNGSQLVSQTFTSATAARAYFRNNALDLGLQPGSAYNVTISMSETISSPNSGFYGNVMIGDAPAAMARPVSVSAPAATRLVADSTDATHDSNSEHAARSPSGPSNGSDASFAHALFEAAFGGAAAWDTSRTTPPLDNLQVLTASWLPHHG